MGAPTPWQAARAVRQQPEPHSKLVAAGKFRLEPHSYPLLPGQLRQNWPYALAAVGNIAVFFMLFQTWLVTPNWSGSNAVDAFGTTHTTTTHINLWSQEQPPGTTVTGAWGILAGISIFFTVFAAIQAVYRGTKATGFVTSAASVAVALFVLIDLFYIRSKQVPVQMMTGMGNDLGAQLGLVMMALRGSGAYPWPGVQYVLNAAHMTQWAWSTAMVALGSAAVAVTRSWYSGLREVVTNARRQTRMVAGDSTREQ